MIPIAKPLIGDEERAAVDAVLASGGLAQGPEVAAFEEEFSAHVDGRYCVAVNSGTSALHLGLLAAGVGPGDEVIVPSFTFAATANAVRLVGAQPVFVDIDPFTFCMSPDAVRAAVTDRTVAIMPVHLYGQMADMPSLVEIAVRHGLFIMEDAAQAHLASLDGRPAGAWGNLAAFSFYPTKNMTTGEGGIVVTDDEHVARQVRLLRNQGMEARYENEVIGFNTRMTDIAAAIGRVQLTKLVAWTERRRSNALTLDAGLSGVVVPPVATGAFHVYHQYTVRSGERAALMEKLSKARIGFGIYYPMPVHRLPSFDVAADLPETERAAEEVLSLPVGPHVSEVEIGTIIEAVNA